MKPEADLPNPSIAMILRPTDVWHEFNEGISPEIPLLLELV